MQRIFARQFFSLCLLIFSGLITTSCNGQENAKDSSISNASTTVSEKKEMLDELIGAYADYGDFNGAILVAEKGSILYQGGLGFANMEWDIPNGRDTKFRLASITKQFTAMVILQLVAEGKLELHEPISTFLPDYPEENGDRITIHHLLSHSSGIPNNYPSTKEATIKPDSYAPQSLVDEFSGLSLEFTPGEKFSYSNAGYTLLGFIIEKTTNKPYAEALQDRIFNPLKMVNSGFDKHRAILKNRAKGYFKSWGEYYNSNYIDMSNVFAAGALYSTVEDMHLWDQALYTEQLLPKEYRHLMFSPQIPDLDYGGHYGYGWGISKKSIGNSGETLLAESHDGVIDGFCALYTRIPTKQISIILLSNVRRAPLNAMTKGIMGILYDKPYDFPKQSIAFSLLAEIEDKGVRKGVAFYRNNKNDSSYYLDENEMNVISYKLLQSERAVAAAEVLKLAIEAFPEAFNIYDSYGEVLASLGKKEEAIINYKKSVALNPSNENGIKKLKELGVEMDSNKQ